MKIYLKSSFLFYILIIGCNTKPIQVGNFASKNSHYGLYIYADSTFSYKYYEDHAYEYSAGRWYGKNNGRIILNSYYKDITIPLTLISSEHNASSDNKLSFEFTSDQIEAKDCECAIFINDSLKEIRRCDSMSSVEVKEPLHQIFLEVRKSPLLLTSFRFSLNPLLTSIYKPSQGTGNILKLNIAVKDSFFSYKIFDEVSVRIKKKGLYYFELNTKRKIKIPRLLNDSVAGRFQ